MRRVFAQAALLLALPLGLASAELRLPSVLSDHMVVQRDASMNVWGWSDPGATVRVIASWNDEQHQAPVAEDGRFRATIPTPAAGGPHTITVTNGTETILLANVLSGDVWVCSGQSNMEWPLHNTDGGAEHVAGATHPDIRLFDVTRRFALTEQTDCEGAWSACTPESVTGFSAVGYHFGARLHAELGVPIGLIGSNWGGTRAEAWTSARTLRVLFPEFADEQAEMKRLSGGESDEPSLSELRQAWWKKLEAEDPGMTGGWMGTSLASADGWAPIPVPGTWKEVGLGGFDGTLWYRRTVEVPASWAGRDLELSLGPIDDMDMTWFNGELVGQMRGGGSWNTPRVYEVPGELVRAGANTIAVCAIDTGGAGRLGNEGMRLAAADGDETVLPLDGDWRYRQGASLRTLGNFPNAAWMSQHRPAALFNGMLAPILPFTVKGAIWYQGESNRQRAAQYRRLFGAMISDWRSRWRNPQMPFYFVQLAPFGYGGDEGELSELREAQAMALELPNTGMAVTMDVGNPRDIHPRDKETVGERLAMNALAKTYGKDVAYMGPTFASATAEGDGLRVKLTHADGLTSRDKELVGFAIAGEDQVFHPAMAVIRDGTVLVRSDAVAKPVAVRYCWGATDEGRLWNAAGLPASSFRSDDWPLISKER